jgi:flagellar biosynthesis/type III secretory pathway chaperone
VTQPPGTLPLPALEAALESELASLEALERALTAEREALTGRDSAAIDTAVQEKQTLLETHIRLQQTRIDLCAGQPLGDAIAALSEPHQAGELRDRILAQGERCDAMNRENGQLIRRQQDRAQRALGILRASDGGPGLYAGDGSTEKSGDRQSLGKA